MNMAKKFSIPRFLLSVGFQYSMLVLIFCTLCPKLWATQLRAGPWALFAVLIAMQVANCFFEWFFHRYVLHRVVIKHLAGLTASHRQHHTLTPIKLVPSSESTGRIILNRYPILEEEQFASAAFPRYALVIFWLLFSPLLIGAQVLFPRAPILLGGYSSVTLSMVSYEVFHAVEHFSYDWWKGATEHPKFGWLWRRVYGFHHFHHANIGANEAIGGCFIMPLADWVMGTYHQPPDLLLDGRIATAKQFAVHPPRRFVIALDRWAKHRESRFIHHNSSTQNQDPAT